MVDLVREFGLPTAFLIIILLGSGVGLRWFAKSIVQPLVNGHIDYLQQSLSEQAKSHQDLKDKLERNENEHERILRLLEQ